MKLMRHAVRKFFQSVPNLKRSMWQSWYNFIINYDDNKLYLLMNYGYCGIEPENDPPLSIAPAQEEYRLRIQLYHHVATGADISGKEVLEVGCGCGGGAAYIANHLGPAHYKGLDYSQNAVEACKKYHTDIPNLSFIHGDAENLPFDEDSYDIILNVESSHTYGNTSRFFSEVYRVLRLHGYFLFADFREKEDVPKLRQKLLDAGLKIIREENITPNVVKALALDDERKTGLIQRSGVKGIFQTPFKAFAGTKDSITYKTFENGDVEYLYFVLQKTGK